MDPSFFTRRTANELFASQLVGGPDGCYYLFTRCPFCMKNTNFRFPASHRTHNPEYLWIEASNFSSPDRCSNFVHYWSEVEWQLTQTSLGHLPERRCRSGATNQQSKNLEVSYGSLLMARASSRREMVAMTGKKWVSFAESSWVAKSMSTMGQKDPNWWMRTTDC